MVKPFKNFRRDLRNDLGTLALPRAIGTTLMSVAALAIASCHSAPPSQQASPEPEPWEKVVAEDPLFEGEATNDVIKSLCGAGRSAMDSWDSGSSVNFKWDGRSDSCSGAVHIPTGADTVAVSSHFSFAELNRNQQREIAKHLIDDHDASTCDITDYVVESPGQGTRIKRETANGEYCYYLDTGNSSPAAGEGWYVAGNTAINAKFETTDEEADSDKIQEHIHELLDLTMEALLAEYPHT